MTIDPGPVDYAQFLERDRGPGPAWGIRHLYRAARLAEGRRGLLGVIIPMALAALPPVILTAIALARHEWSIGPWAVLAVLAFGSGRTDLSCGGGCAWLLVMGIVAAGSGLILGRVHPYGWWMPLWMHYASGLVQSVAVYNIGCLMRSSPEIYRKLADAGELFFVAPAGDPATIAGGDRPGDDLVPPGSTL